jgi:hypothetical protein
LLLFSGRISENTEIRPDRTPCIEAVSPMHGNGEPLSFPAISACSARDSGFAFHVCLSVSLEFLSSPVVNYWFDLHP